MEIPKIDPFWDDQLVNPAHSGHRHGAPNAQPISGGAGGGVPVSAHSPYERNLNFATVAVEDGEYGFPKKKTVRDPLSHRIIEKRRRDRMNNCLADLARLLPPSSLRKGRGRIEKTEIVELAIKHLRHLQCHPCPMGDKCEYSIVTDGAGLQNNSSAASCSSFSTSSGYHSKPEEQFRLGFQECLSEAMHFLVEQEGLYAGDAMCVRLVKHLNGHCETVLRDHWGNQGKVVPGFRRTTESGPELRKTGCSGGSISSGYHPNGSSSGSDGNGGNDGEGTESFVLPVQNQNPPQYMNVENSRHSSSVMDYEAENSCSSTPLSIETSDVLSSDGKNNTRLSTKPPIPSIICSHSSNNGRLPVNSGSPANGSTNGRISDDGSANSSTSSAHRYKFKSNIKQRFTADCQVKPDDGSCFTQGHPEKSSSHGGAECDRDGDMASDTEEIRDEGISLMEDGMTLQSCRQSEGEDCESVRSIKHSSPSMGGSTGVRSNQFYGGGACTTDKTTQQISAVDTPPSTSPATSLIDKTVFSSSNSAVGSKSSRSSSTATPTTPLIPHLEGQRRREVEVKPSPEELLTAMSKLNNSGSSKNQLPLIVGGDMSPPLDEEKGVPAFALHEKGLFYIPLTIDKSIVSHYISKLDSTEAPPLYPVTISVCFLPKPDKKGNFETLHETEIAALHHSKPEDFSRSAISPVPMSLISGAVTVAAVPTKPSRKGYREGNPFLSSRNSAQRLTPKDSNSLSRLSGAGGTIYQGNYQDGNSTASSATRGLAESNRGGESESHASSGCGRASNAGGGDGSNSGSSGASRGRKRSISSSPSISGGSLGYHSWHDKTSPNSPDFFNYHLNTHNLQAIAVHGHLTTTARHVDGALSPMMEQRHGQVLNSFHHADNASLKEKEMCFGLGHDKRSKKTRGVDQTMETK